jgi:hypothetical protein
MIAYANPILSNCWEATFEYRNHSGVLLEQFELFSTIACFQL